jgi:hypothetical protein
MSCGYCGGSHDGHDPCAEHRIKELQVEITDLRDRPRRPSKVMVLRTLNGDYVRAAGDVVCGHCGFKYYDHDEVRGYEWLHILCDGRLVKL